MSDIKNAVEIDSSASEKTERKIKTIANCTLNEFLKQANKIRKEVADFWECCGIGNIFNSKPEFPDDATDEQRKEIEKSFSKKKMNDLLDSMLEVNTDKTIKIIGLCCFMSEEQANEMDALDFLDVAFEIIASERVIGFFSKLGRSGLIDTGN